MLTGFGRLKSHFDGAVKTKAVDPATDHCSHGRRRRDGLTGIVRQPACLLDPVEQAGQRCTGGRDSDRHDTHRRPVRGPAPPCFRDRRSCKHGVQCGP